MTLNNYFYINKSILDDYLSNINNGLSNEETRKVGKERSLNLFGKMNFAGIDKDSKKVESIEQTVIKTDSAKIQALMTYLKKKKLLKGSYDQISESDFEKLEEGDFVEIKVIPSFSKLHELSEAIQYFKPLVALSGIKNTKEESQAIKCILQMNKQNGIGCIFNFEDGEYPFVANLKRKFFLCDLNEFESEEYTVLCKIQKKIKKGNSVSPDNLLKQINNTQKIGIAPVVLDKNSRQAFQQITNVVQGPAFRVIPIAIYQ